MRRFQFRLQTALDLRRRRQDQLTAELADARRRHRIELACLERLAADKDRTLSRGEDQRTGRLQAGDLAARERYLGWLDDAIADQTARTKVVEAEAERKNDELIAASQATRALEELREQLLEEHRGRESREEQKRLDEFAGRTVRSFSGPAATDDRRGERTEDRR